MTNTDFEKGTLYLIPNTLGKTPKNNTIPNYVLNIIRQLDVFVVENVKTAARYLRNHANDKLEYTNVTTGESVVRKAKADYADNVRVSFPIDVRQAINITPTDDLKLAIPEEATDAGAVDEPTESISELKEQIEEMHEMISELYDAYTEVKND